MEENVDNNGFKESVVWMSLPPDSRPAAARHNEHAVAKKLRESSEVIDCENDRQSWTSGLSNEILKHIFGFLNTTEHIFIIRNVCRHWMCITKRPKRVDFGAWCRSEVTVKASKFLWQIFDLTDIENVDFSYVQSIDPASLPIIFQNTVPRRISLAACEGIQDSHLLALKQHLQSVVYLDISFSESVSERQIASALGHAPKLSYLFLRGCKQVGNIVLKAIETKCKGLRLLNLYSCEKLSNEGVAGLVSKCNQLKFLNFSLCTRLTDQALSCISKLSELRHLNLAGCELLRDNGARTLSLCSKLELLDLSWCMDITDIGICDIVDKCTGLVSLQLVGCSALTDTSIEHIALHCAHLTVLKISGCGLLTDQALFSLAQHSMYLTQLFCSRCTKLTENGVEVIHSACHRLRALELYGCPKIKPGYLDTLPIQVWHDDAFGSGSDSDTD